MSMTIEQVSLVFPSRDERSVGVFFFRNSHHTLPRVEMKKKREGGLEATHSVEAERKRMTKRTREGSRIYTKK